MDSYTRIKYLENKLRRARQQLALFHAELEIINKLRAMGWKNGLAIKEQEKIWNIANELLLHPNSTGKARELVDYLREVLDEEVWMPPDVFKRIEPDVELTTFPNPLES